MDASAQARMRQDQRMASFHDAAVQVSNGIDIFVSDHFYDIECEDRDKMWEAFKALRNIAAMARKR